MIYHIDFYGSYGPKSTFQSITSIKINIFENQFHFQSTFFKAILLRYQTQKSIFSDFSIQGSHLWFLKTLIENKKSTISVRKKMKTDLKSVGKTLSFAPCNDESFWGNHPNIHIPTVIDFTFNCPCPDKKLVLSVLTYR